MSSTTDQPRIRRRDALALLGASSAALTLGRGGMVTGPDIGSSQMRVTCMIRYEIDPFQRDAFQEYAENWGRIIPRCGGHLVGYFLPHEGTNNVGWGLIAFDSLAAYEAYRHKLKANPEARRNFAFAHTKRFIVREERTFVEIVDGTFGVPKVG